MSASCHRADSCTEANTTGKPSIVELYRLLESSAQPVPNSTVHEWNAKSFSLKCPCLLGGVKIAEDDAKEAQEFARAFSTDPVRTSHGRGQRKCESKAAEGVANVVTDLFTAKGVKMQSGSVLLFALATNYAGVVVEASASPTVRYSVGGTRKIFCIDSSDLHAAFQKTIKLQSEETGSLGPQPTSNP